MEKLIKFYDISKQDQKINKKILNSIKQVVLKKNFINGADVTLFEKKFSSLVNSKYSIACSNGTDALTIALKSLNLKKGSEVIMPAMTYISTAYAILNANLTPVLVDIDLNNGLMDLNKLKNKITKKTKVILPVHLYGNVIEIDNIKINKNVFIIDDASQAHGAQYLNKKFVGSINHLSCFSLYPGKNLGAYGDAGIITTNSKIFYKQIIRLSNLGLMREQKYDHEIIGNNNRLDTIQAAVLNAKIKHLKLHNNLRRKIANIYIKKIKNKKIKILKNSKYSVFHQFIVLVKNRKKFMNYMIKNNIQTGIHYPKAINQHKSLKKFFKKSRYKNAELFSNQCVSLPIDPYLNMQEVKKIIDAVNKF